MFKNLTGAALLAVAAAAAVSTVFAAGDRAPAPPLKVAFVYVTPIGQAGWTYQHNRGRLQMAKTLGPRVETSYVESVAEGADAERVIRDLARQGNRLIFATSFGYLEPALRVAAEYPDVKFEVAGGYKTAANVDTYNARYYEARYLAGMLAGTVSRSGIAGYVAAFAVPEVVQGINAFALGMQAVNPRAQVRVLWLDSWFDPARASAAAQTLVDQGADVLTHHSVSAAVAQTAQANFRTRGVRFIAYQSDMRSFAPDAQLAAVTAEWGVFYSHVAQQVLDGSWTPVPVWGGIKDRMVDLSALAPDVPPAARALVDARRAAIVAGRLEPFAAPLVDNQGHTRLAQGALDDRAIATMDWLVRGVVGTLPR